MSVSESEREDTEFDSEIDPGFLAIPWETGTFFEDEKYGGTSTGKNNKTEIANTEQEIMLQLQHLTRANITSKVFEQLDTVQHVAERFKLKGEAARNMKKAVIFLRAATKVISKRSQTEDEILLLKSQIEKLESRVEDQVELILQMHLDMAQMKKYIKKENGLGKKVEELVGGTKKLKKVEEPVRGTRKLEKFEKGESSKKNEEDEEEVNAACATPGPTGSSAFAEDATEEPSLENTLEESATSYKKKLPRKAPRGAVVLFSIHNARSLEEYLNALLAAQDLIDIPHSGLDDMRIRSSRNGAYLLEYRGRNKEEKADKLASVLREIMPGPRATIYRPVKWATLKLTILPESVTQVEIKDLIAKEGKCSPCEIHTSQLMRSRRGIYNAWVRCPLEAAITIARKESILLRGTPCKVELLKAQTQRCYKCLMEGHFTKSCEEPWDFSRICHKCCQEGHISRDCKNEEECILCRGEGFDYHHRVASEKCLTRAPKSKPFTQFS